MEFLISSHYQIPNMNFYQKNQYTQYHSNEFDNAKSFHLRWLCFLHNIHEIPVPFHYRIVPD